MMLSSPIGSSTCTTLSSARVQCSTSNCFTTKPPRSHSPPKNSGSHNEYQRTRFLDQLFREHQETPEQKAKPLCSQIANGERRRKCGGSRCTWRRASEP